MTLSENKAALIEAHRNEDWETAKLLSQERERIKKHSPRRCGECGIPLSPSNRSGLCTMHNPFHRLSMRARRWIPLFMKTKLTSVLLLVASLTLNAAGQFLAAPTNPPAQVTFGWTASADPTCTGYYLWYGTGSRQYTNKVATGNVTNFTFTIPARGVQYFFTLSAIYPGPLESDWCNEVNYTAKKPAAPGGLLPPISLVVQAKPMDDPAAQWADAWSWSLSPGALNQQFRLHIVTEVAAVAPASQVKATPQERAMRALHATIRMPPMPGN